MSNRSRRVRQSLKDKTKHAVAEAARYRQADEMNRGLLRHQSDRLHELERVLNDAMLEAGELCSLFPPQVRAMQNRRHFDAVPTYRVPGGPMLSPPFLLSDDMPGSMVMNVLDLPLVMMKCRETGKFDDRVHVELRFEDSTSAYAISKKALSSMDRRRLEQTIQRVFMPELARHLVKQVKP